MADNLGVNEMDYDNQDLPLLARRMVRDEVLQHTDLTGDDLRLDQVLLVWFSKSLKNWKALVTTTLPDGAYYEVTHNGEKSETYVDVYVKKAQCVIEDVDIPGLAD